MLVCRRRSCDAHRYRCCDASLPRRSECQSLGLARWRGFSSFARARSGNLEWFRQALRRSADSAVVHRPDESHAWARFHGRRQLRFNAALRRPLSRAHRCAADPRVFLPGTATTLFRLKQSRFSHLPPRTPVERGREGHQILVAFEATTTLAASDMDQPTFRKSFAKKVAVFRRLQACQALAGLGLL